MGGLGWGEGFSYTSDVGNNIAIYPEHRLKNNESMIMKLKPLEVHNRSVKVTGRGGVEWRGRMGM